MYIFFLGASICLWQQIVAMDSSQYRNVAGQKPIPWARGQVIYKYHSFLGQSQKNVIKGAMDEIKTAVSVRNVTCVEFHEKKGDFIRRANFVFIQLNYDGVCRSDTVGMKGGEQALHVSESCISKSGLIQLFLSILGLYHEHQRPDRDHYVKIHMENVLTGNRSMFEKLPGGDKDLFAYGYDFDSMTHYGPFDYGINTSLPTISVLPNVSVTTFGNRRTLSYYDILKIQRLYGSDQDNKHTTLSNFDNIFILLEQIPPERYYPQWLNTTEHIPYHPLSCSNVPSGTYSYTKLNGAKWTSLLTLPPGDFCVSLDYCIASYSPNPASYIQLSAQDNVPFLNLTYTNGKWAKREVSKHAEQGWIIWIKGHILWGLDVLAIDNVLVKNGTCV